jgi:hypothetical protein
LFVPKHEIIATIYFHETFRDGPVNDQTKIVLELQKILSGTQVEVSPNIHLRYFAEAFSGPKLEPGRCVFRYGRVQSG